MEFQQEVDAVVRYSQNFDGQFYKLMGQAVMIGSYPERIAIKRAFPDWWRRCQQNLLAMEKRGRPVELDGWNGQ